jgi:O-methyltransferase
MSLPHQHTASLGDSRALYLDLLERCLTNLIYEDPPLPRRSFSSVWQRSRFSTEHRETGKDWPSQAHTMIGLKRLHALRQLVERTIQENIAGDYIETGVWRGGACILMRGVLAAYGDTKRIVYCADSFEGLPPPDAAKYPADRKDKLYRFRELAVSLDQVKANFAQYGLLDDQVRFVKGWFRDTLPTLNVKQFALLRLDGDLYESTIVALQSLYDRLTPGGFAIIDDYGALGGCRKAVHDFLDQRKERPVIEVIDQTGVWWQKRD